MQKTHSKWLLFCCMYIVEHVCVWTVNVYIFSAYFHSVYARLLSTIYVHPFFEETCNIVQLYEYIQHLLITFFETIHHKHQHTVALLLSI